jgi:hypothetical protein
MKKEQQLDLYHQMVLIRRVEERGAELYQAGKIIDLNANLTNYKTSHPPCKDLEYKIESFNSNGISDQVQLFVPACK